MKDLSLRQFVRNKSQRYAAELIGIKQSSLQDALRLGTMRVVLDEPGSVLFRYTVKVTWVAAKRAKEPKIRVIK